MQFTLISDRNVKIKLRVAHKTYDVSLRVNGDASGRANELAVSLRDDHFVFGYEPTMFSGIKQKYVSFYRIDMDLNTGKLSDLIIETVPIKQSRGSTVQVAVPKVKALMARSPRGTKKTILFAMVPVDSADNGLDWPMAVDAAGLTQLAVSSIDSAAEVIEELMPIPPEDVEESCDNALMAAGVCRTEFPPLLHCPPTEAKAKVDDRFELYPARYTNKITKAKVCYITTGAAELLQQCCYNADGKIACDAPHGGTAILYHPVSQSTLHTTLDVAPRQACCKNSYFDWKICSKFFKCRPSPPDCGQDYKPPDYGGGVTDPHYTTFDKVKYDFMGYGEYWLYRTDNEKVQARQTTNTNNLRVTWFKAAVIQCGNTTFQAEHDESQGKEKKFEILLYQDRKRFDMMYGTQNVLLSPYMSVSFGTKETNKAKISVKCGRTSVDLSFHFYISGPHYMKYVDIMVSATCNMGTKITGLVGNCNGNPDDDFTPPGATSPALKPGASTKDIYEKFGEKWRITPAESLFVYGSSSTRSTKSFVNEPPPGFDPMVETPDPKTFPQEIQDACQTNLNCYVDYNATGSLALGLSVKAQDEEMEQITAILNTPNPQYCNLLPHIENGAYEPDRTLFEVGERVYISCQENYTLVGLRSMVCPLDQKWPETPVAACFPSHLFHQDNSSDEGTTTAQPGGTGNPVLNIFADQAAEAEPENKTVIAPPNFISGVVFDVYQTIRKLHPLETLPVPLPPTTDEPTTSKSP